MTKEKKIGFHYSLYKTAKDKKVDNNGKEIYPLALNVTYNRKSTKFPLSRNELPQVYFTEEGVDKKLYYDQFTKVLEQQIEGIIRFESHIVGDKYSIKGIKERMFFYRSRLMPILDSSMVARLKKVLGDYYTYNEFVELLNPLAIVNEEIASSFVFLFEYNFFDEKKFIIKDKSPKEFIDLIAVYFLVSAFETHKGNDIINEKNKGLFLLDWVFTTFKSDFKDFVDSDASKEVLHKIKAQDEIFAKVFEQYEEEVMNANFDEVWSSLGLIATQSDKFSRLKHRLDFMKSG